MAAMSAGAGPVSQLRTISWLHTLFAEEGIHAASPEAYSSEPEGPTHSADD